jgi:hypothetical protein
MRLAAPVRGALEFGNSRDMEAGDNLNPRAHKTFFNFFLILCASVSDAMGRENFNGAKKISYARTEKIPGSLVQL